MAAELNNLLRHWKPGQPIGDRPKRLLIGVATYSYHDLRLLNLVDEALTRSENSALQVDVFDTGDCQSHEDFEKYIPGIGKVYQTPVAGLWENWVLRAKAWGKPARDLVAAVCQLDPLAMERLVEDVFPQDRSH
jgi:hypothetical protein